MKELIGKTINSVHINEDGTVLKFSTDAGDMYYECYGDCCSETWFADIIDSDFFLCNRVSHLEYARSVTDVEELEIPEWINEMANRDSRGRQEHEQVYGYKIKARINNDSWRNRDFCDLVIIFRNSSNGYYGGSVELVKDDEWHKNMLGRVTAYTYTKLTGDWRSE